jgi:predicted Zn finger-like uncharacterized protein
MIISCQACSTRYLIEPAALGPKGRLVRCAKCGHSWQQKPPADMPLQIDADAPPPGLVDLPPVPPPRRRWSRGLALPLLVILLLVAGIGAGYVFRERIVQRWPQSGQIYEAIGLPVHAGGGENALAQQQLKQAEGLELDNINYTRQQDGADTVLQVQGEVFNPTQAEVTLPHLTVLLRDDSGKVLLDWTFDIDRPTIHPGEIIPFKSETRNPPAAATKLAVNFSATK